jgi:hypothetical protein
MYYKLALVVLLPLAACLPPWIKEEICTSSTDIIAERKHWLDLAQFDWQDYVLSEVSLNCDRATVDEMYQCIYKCMGPLTHFVFLAYRTKWKTDLS